MNDVLHFVAVIELLTYLLAFNELLFIVIVVNVGVELVNTA